MNPFTKGIAILVVIIGSALLGVMQPQARPAIQAACAQACRRIMAK